MPLAVTVNLLAAVGCPASTARVWERPLSDMALKFGITTGRRLADALAQFGHESAGFTRTVESLNYQPARMCEVWPNRFRSLEDAKPYAQNPAALAEKVYGGRLGNVHPGDGWRYIGRGVVMVTGRENYRAVTRLLREAGVACPNFEEQPSALAEPRWAALAAGAIWQDRGCNELSDAGDFRGITYRINGGYVGLKDREARRARAMAALKGIA